MSNVNPEVTTVGYLPNIQAPANDYDTINTVVKRIVYRYRLANYLGQKHAVLTFDQALFPQLMQLK